MGCGPMIFWRGSYFTGRTQRFTVTTRRIILNDADDLKLYMRVSSTDDCRLFQQDLYHLQGWCSEMKYDLNDGKCKSISFTHGTIPLMFQYVIGDSDLERVDVINDLGVLVDNRMTFVNHIESIVSKSARKLGFIKRMSSEFNDHYTYKTLYVTFVRPGLEYASWVWSPHQEVHSARIERIQHNFIRFELQGLGWVGLLSLCLLMRADAT
jgi:hypothetical protein